MFRERASHSTSSYINEITRSALQILAIDLHDGLSSYPFSQGNSLIRLQYTHHVEQFRAFDRYEIDASFVGNSLGQ